MQQRTGHAGQDAILGLRPDYAADATQCSGYSIKPVVREAPGQVLRKPRSVFFRSPLARIAFRLLNLCLEPWLRNCPEGFILLYHRVHPEPDPASPPLPPQFFEAHLHELQRHFRVLPLEELVARHRAGRPLSGCCSLTFDDGFGDFLTHAVPLLQRYSFPATNFLVLDCLTAGRPTWNYRANRARLSPEARTVLGALQPELREQMLPPAEVPMVDLEAARQAPALVSWGSHTRTHSWLSRLPDDRLAWEIDRSAFQAALGQEVTFLSYPNDMANPRVYCATREAGYTAAFSVGDRRIRVGEDPFSLPRFDVGALWGAFLRLEVMGVLPALRRLKA